MNSRELEELGYWHDTIDQLVFDPFAARIEECTQRINTILSDSSPKGLPAFLWRTFSYVNGNAYFLSPDGPFRPSHRVSPTEPKLGNSDAYQIRLPWLRIFRDDAGGPAPISHLERQEHPGRYTEIGPSDTPGIATRAEEDAFERDYPGLDVTENTPFLCQSWLEAHPKHVRVVIFEPELVFFRLYLDPAGYRPSPDQLAGLRGWLVGSPEEARLVTGPLYPADPDAFVRGIESGDWAGPRPDEVEAAAARRRCNPVREMHFWDSRNLLFFPTGRVYLPGRSSEGGQLMNAYFLGIFRRAEKIRHLHQQQAVGSLLAKVCAFGTHLGQMFVNEQQTANHRMMSGNHTFATQANTVSSLLEAIHDRLCPACRERTERPRLAVKSRTDLTTKFTTLLRAGADGRAALRPETFDPTDRLRELLRTDRHFLRAILCEGKVWRSVRGRQGGDPDDMSRTALRHALQGTRRDALDLRTGPPCRVTGDRDVFDQIVERLVENGLTHTDWRAHPAARLAFRVAVVAGEVELRATNPAATDIIARVNKYNRDGLKVREFPPDFFSGGRGLDLLDFYTTLFRARPDGLRVTGDGARATLTFRVRLGPPADAPEGAPADGPAARSG